MRLFYHSRERMCVFVFVFNCEWERESERTLLFYVYVRDTKVQKHNWSEVLVLVRENKQSTQGKDNSEQLSSTCENGRAAMKGVGEINIGSHLC